MPSARSRWAMAWPIPPVAPLLLVDGSTDRDLPHRGVPYFRAASRRPGNSCRQEGGSRVEGVPEFSDEG